MIKDKIVLNLQKDEKCYYLIKKDGTKVLDIIDNCIKGDELYKNIYENNDHLIMVELSAIDDVKKTVLFKHLQELFKNINEIFENITVSGEVNE